MDEGMVDAASAGLDAPAVELAELAAGQFELGDVNLRSAALWALMTVFKMRRIAG
ncbi:hypothetical protein [Streptomyces sp. NPDC046161]|uniref:hypothetical protein n=1 Tax=Streptomyces sp. NPDC046161 TaxID=3155132 RepID=UPI0033E5FA68